MCVSATQAAVNVAPGPSARDGRAAFDWDARDDKFAAPAADREGGVYIITITHKNTLSRWYGAVTVVVSS